MNNSILPLKDHNWTAEEPVIVSIVVATYNHEKFITQAIEGFLCQQTSFRVEILVNDDASLDKTALIVKQYELKYPYLFNNSYQTENQFSQGKKPWFHILFPRARGKYIAICEGDDFWIDPRKLQKQVDFLESHSDYAFCSHYVNRVDANGQVIKEAIVADRELYFSPKEIFHFTFPTLSLVFRNVSMTYPSPSVKGYNGDAILTGQLTSHGKAAHLNFLGAAYRVHNGGVFSGNGYIQNAFRSIETRKIMLGLDSFSEWQKEEIHKNLRKRKLSLTKYALRTLNFGAIQRAIRL